MRILHWLAHLTGMNGCKVVDFPEGHWVVCMGCGERSFQLTTRTKQEYDNLVAMGLKQPERKHHVGHP